MKNIMNVLIRVLFWMLVLAVVEYFLGINGYWGAFIGAIFGMVYVALIDPYLDGFFSRRE